ncbi:LysR family transcriptional regulator [Citromicrobium bathyomarinum]|uniref:LysR family transcriptional regulator n=1 Tax=Citromicrobium bathyomarinum TaxID=72174 RepID=UPI00315AEDBA
MHLRWLEDLVCVAEEGHFARAAERRHVTQSALSRRIKSLELWAGAELLDRSKHPIRLTAAGAEFVTVARGIIGQAYEARLRPKRSRAKRGTKSPSPRSTHWHCISSLRSSRS